MGRKIRASKIKRKNCAKKKNKSHIKKWKMIYRVKKRGKCAKKEKYCDNNGTRKIMLKNKKKLVLKKEKK